jgi:predicted ester cyclase
MTNHDFATKWFAAIDANDTKTMNSMLAPDHRFHSPMGEPMTGEGHIGMIQGMNSSFTDFKHNFDTVVSEGNWIAIHGHTTCKHTGDFNGIAATGREVAFTWTDMMQIVGGKLADEHMEFSPMTLMQQVS